LKISERAEEILEILWLRRKEGRPIPKHHRKMGLDDKNQFFREVIEKGLVKKDGDKLRFTKKGSIVAENVIRRQRLAERLLIDVLNVKENLEETACRFEHLLHKGIDDDVCTLLGHPRFCPHGGPIPPGKCCRANLQRVERIVRPLSTLEPGQKGSVAYVYGEDSKRLQKLISMGVIPGRPIKLSQKFPSYIFQIDHTQIAVDNDIAKRIYVRIEKT